MANFQDLPREIRDRIYEFLIRNLLRHCSNVASHRTKYQLKDCCSCRLIYGPSQRPSRTVHLDAAERVRQFLEPLSGTILYDEALELLATQYAFYCGSYPRDSWFLPRIRHIEEPVIRHDAFGAREWPGPLLKTALPNLHSVTLFGFRIADSGTRNDPHRELNDYLQSVRAWGTPSERKLCGPATKPITKLAARINKRLGDKPLLEYENSLPSRFIWEPNPWVGPPKGNTAMRRTVGAV